MFWRATVSEWFMAIAGHNRANRIEPEPLSQAEFRDLADAYPDTRSLKDRRHRG